MRRNVKYDVEIANDDLPLVLGMDKYLRRGRIKSRHVSNKVSYAYILVNRPALNSVGYLLIAWLATGQWAAVLAHVMTILWYLSWARFRPVEAPARFLDDIFYEYDEE